MSFRPAFIRPALLGLLATLYCGAVLAQTECLVTATSAGAVKLGMTVAHARKLLAPLKLERGSDGDGAALIAVMRGPNLVMNLYAGEADAAEPVNERGRIASIDVLDRSYRTALGLHVGMPLAAAERRAGALRQIEISEIESREYASFVRQPRRLWIRVLGGESEAGIYAKGQRKTHSYNADAHIHSLAAVGVGRRIPPINPSGPVAAARPCHGGA